MSAPRALVTGASTGIGAVYADRLAQRGHGLLVVARDPTRLNALVSGLSDRYRVPIESLAIDLAAPAGIEALEARLALGDIELAINNAGVATPGTFTEMALADIVDTIAVNIGAATRVARAVLPGMVARDCGTLVNIVSIAGLMNDRPGPSVIYSASKAFALSLSEGLNHELAGTGIRVQAVLPGVTRTPIWSKSAIDVDAAMGDVVMDVEALVDAALRGLDLGETVTLPTLHDLDRWQAFLDARTALYPGLSNGRPAPRYGEST